MSSCEGKNKEALARSTHGVEGACVATKPTEGLLTNAGIGALEMLVDVLLHQRGTLAPFGMPLRVEAVHSPCLDPLQILARSNGRIVEPACPII